MSIIGKPFKVFFKGGNMCTHAPTRYSYSPGRSRFSTKTKRENPWYTDPVEHGYTVEMSSSTFLTSLTVCKENLGDVVYLIDGYSGRKYNMLTGDFMDAIKAGAFQGVNAFGEWGYKKTGTRQSIYLVQFSVGQETTTSLTIDAMTTISEAVNNVVDHAQKYGVEYTLRCSGKFTTIERKVIEGLRRILDGKYNLDEVEDACKALIDFKKRLVDTSSETTSSDVLG